VQAFGKEPFDSIHQFQADLVSVCAHKFYGPKGAGALFVRSPLLPDPILFGGGHENERRAGTENLAAIIGFTEAMERFVRTPVFPRDKLKPLTHRLIGLAQKLGDIGVVFRGTVEERLSNTVAFTVRGCDSIALLAGLDLEGICASSGSACSAGSLEPSHVMLALGVPREEANSLVRFSLGRESTLEDIERVEEVFPRIIERAQSFQ
jgi:cysteine desulfurase